MLFFGEGGGVGVGLMFGMLERCDEILTEPIYTLQLYAIHL